MNPGPAPEYGAAFEMMSRVAHELRQPLSSIESIAYYLTLVLPKSEARVQEQLSRIQELIAQSHWVLSSGLRLSHPNEGAPGMEVDLEEMITEALAAQPRHFNLELSGALPPVRLDPDQAKALVESVLMLFRQLATAAHPVTIRTGVSPGVFMQLSCNAPGYRAESALCPGASLGIEAARRMVEAQGGSLEIAVTPDLVRVCVRLA